jgi:hypothetical protein
MQYVEGDTLAVRLQRGRLPADQSAESVGQIAEHCWLRTAAESFTVT